MKRITITFLSILIPLLALAQEREMLWENVTALHFAATGGTDQGHALQQYLLFDEAVLNRNRDLYDRYYAFAKEFSQMTMNQRIPEGMAEMDEAVKQIRKMMKEHPELADQLKEALAEAEKAKAELGGYVDPSVSSYSGDPATLLRDLKKLAVNQKAYSGWRDIGGGLYAVADGPCYGPVQDDAFSRPRFEEGQEYCWGVIDMNGHEVVPMKYRLIQAYEGQDIIFLAGKDASGRNRAGAVGYDGRVRIPFDYEDWTYVNTDEKTVSMVKDGRIGMLSFDAKVLQPFVYAWTFPMGEWLVRKEEGGPLGVVSADGRLVIPLKYAEYWGHEDGEAKFVRPDGRLDVYDAETYEFLRTEDKPHD